MNFCELIQKRYSVRAYKSDKIEDSKLNKVLEAARLAPTAANRQPFKLLIINTEGRKEELKKIYNKDWFVEAPLILCVCAIPEEAWVRADGKNGADIDAAIIMSHILLAAAEEDLGTCWIGAFNAEIAKKVLNLDSSLEPVAFTPIGYAVENNPPEKKRKALEDIVIHI